MASFGVALRSTKPVVIAPVAPPPPRAETPPPPPPPEPLRLWVAPRSLRSAALQILLEHSQQAQGAQREVEIRERNPMVGAAVAPVGASAAAAASSAASLSPAFSALPSLEDNGTIVSGWVSCLRYLAWKSLTASPSAFAAGSSTVVTPTAASAIHAGFYPLPAGLHTASEVAAAVAAAMPVAPPQAPSAVAAARASFGAAGAAAAAAAGHSVGASSNAAAAVAPSAAPAAPVAPPPPAAAITVSSFVIDSYLESLAPVDCALSDLVHSFLTSASRAPSASTAAGHVGFLSYKFDREGERIVPRWAQQQQAPASSNKLRAAAASHPHPGPADGGEQQHALERSLRTVHAWITDIQSKLATHNPTFNAEKALALMRDTPVEASATLQTTTRKDPATTAAAALPAVPETKEESTVPASSVPLASASASVATSIDAAVPATPPSDPAFRFLLGTTAHTLADFVVFMLLQHCALLHSFLPLLTPHSHPALFGFVSTMERIYASQIYRYLGPLNGLDGVNGRHSLLCRHPMLQIVHTPPAPPPPAAAAVPASSQLASSPTNHNRRDTTVMPDPSSAASAAASSSGAAASTLSVTVTPAAQHAPSPTASPGPATQPSSPNPSTSPQPGSNSSSSGNGSSGGNGQGSKPFVPRLTSATVVASTATRGPASSLAVEEVADLMDYVDQVAVRARAATPATERAAAKKPAPPPSSSPAPPPAVAAAPMSSLAWSRLLSQRLLNAVDHASLGWKTVAERGQVRLLTPLEPNPLGENSSYRSMAVRSVCACVRSGKSENRTCALSEQALD